MFSTISSLLPSALTSKLDKLADNPGHLEQTNDETVKREEMVEGKKEKKKKSTSHETFIVVRPPPAKSNHPLNLQLQLVPAQHTRERSNTTATTPTNSRFSGDFTQGNEPVSTAAQPPPSPAVSESEQNHHDDPQRASSVRSGRSESSAFYASGALSGSVTSFSSTTSTASGRRMIIPLYNLSAHNVMTNTILDAGTDAKVAKFHKRGLEVIGLAILEPAEVWNGSLNGTEPGGAPIQRSISNNSLVPPDHIGGPGFPRRADTPEPTHSPGSSKLSVSSDYLSTPGHPSDPVTTPAQTQTGKKLFGRIFRKKGSGSGHTPTPSVSLMPDESATPIPTLEVRAPTIPSSPTRHAEIVLPPVLGLSPMLAGEAHSPSGLCIAHVWAVRRWLKTDSQGLISGVIGKISREVSSHGHGHTSEPSGWEVRFEWKRGRTKGEKERRHAQYSSIDGRSHTPNRRNSALLSLEDASQHLGNYSTVLVESPRQSLDVSHDRKGSRTASPRRSNATEIGKATSIASSAPSDEDGVHGVTHEDHGEDSDPEDSETPWTCTFTLTHPSHPIEELASRARGKSQGRNRTLPTGIVVTPISTVDKRDNALSDNGHAAGAGPVRIKVATLAPAPHHPKVVCQLKVPFPLPDVEIDQGVLRKRLVLPDGSTRSTIPREHSGLIMTAEEIKDIVCSTAFWLVVRQGFGGLGKKTRKGDGWKIRG